MKLEIKNLYVEVEGKEIIRGVSLEIQKGEVTAIMGPNGSGKSTLSNALMGHPKYKITKGKIFMDGDDITGLEADERARKGLFLSFQYPSEISGVTFTAFLRTAVNQRREKPIRLSDFSASLQEKSSLLDLDSSMIGRYLNEGFSGGEKKKAEMLQLLMLDPDYAILDETDSGLDIDALKTVSKGLNLFSKGKDKGVLLITHYQRFLNYVRPDKVYILMDGKIVHSGDSNLAAELEEKGYDWLKK